MKKLIKKDIPDLVGDCKIEDLKPFDSDDKVVARMKDGKLQKSCLTIRDIQELFS